MHFSVFAFLLENGADPNLDGEKIIAKLEAKMNCEQKIIALIKAGFDLSKITKKVA